MKFSFTALLVLLFFSGFSQMSFEQYQRNFPRVAQAMMHKEDTLRKQFVKAGLQWPVRQMYVRSFKYDSELEVWVRGSDTAGFKLFKTYKICALAGTLGPKRMQGDYQVPEGFYYINEFKPNSDYLLSLGLNYPNASDLILSDKQNPGGDIYIHGSCVTVGCIPIQDFQIEELYVLAMNAKNNGQDFIPVHIFPVRFDKKNSMEYFAKLSKDDQNLQHFALTLKDVYDYFNKEKKLPLISTDAKGGYEILN